MLVKVEAVEFALFRHAQCACQVDEVHEDQRNGEGRAGDDGAADELCFQQRESAVIEESVERR